jgi:Zn-dependent peptidase ImmA (M78 family)/transcriptional regulator with XRE-family HTH domain
MEEFYEFIRGVLIRRRLDQPITMTTPLEEIAATDVGERLRIAREAMKITQAEAAGAIGVARTTLVAVEKGQRRIRINELQQLAKLYGTSINALLRQESVHVDLEPRFRKLSESSGVAANKAVQLMSELARAEVELENLLGVKRTQNFPPERPILRGDVRTQAEHDATELRQRLGLGISPVSDIVTLLELELGVRVYVRRVDTKISGLFAYDEALGPCMLLNANHPRDRRTQTAAHETGHMISNRREPEILHQDEPETSREERYANAFGRAFLMPARAVMQKFQDVTVGSERLTRRHIIVLAHFFGVSREAIVRRLEELGLTKSGTWDWFESNGKITDAQARQVLGDLSTPDAYKADSDRPTSLRLNLLAAEVYRQELLTEGQLARLLHLDRIELRGILDDQEMEGGEPDGVPNLPN